MYNGPNFWKHLDKSETIMPCYYWHLLGSERVVSHMLNYSVDQHINKISVLRPGRGEKLIEGCLEGLPFKVILVYSSTFYM